MPLARRLTDLIPLISVRTGWTRTDVETLTIDRMFRLLKGLLDDE